MEVKLTEYARGSGCGCKIAPEALREILQSCPSDAYIKPLLVGNQTNDDAAVYQINENQAIISTTDFFTPIVDDPFAFGKIAAANALSDVYAMGGKPMLAIALLGFPVEKLPLSLATSMLEGARTICQEAGIPLAGGHSIDLTEPVFGLAVTGSVAVDQLKKNSTAKKGDWLLLTKPIGSGILSSAHKKQLLTAKETQEWIETMAKLNQIGTELATHAEVHALTDVTGFGLLGHLTEMTQGSNLSADIFYPKIPIIENAKRFANQGISPDATSRNWNAYHQQTELGKFVPVLEAFRLLPDPQTNGGLLIAVSEKGLSKVQRLLETEGSAVHAEPIGKMKAKAEKTLYFL